MLVLQFIACDFYGGDGRQFTLLVWLDRPVGITVMAVVDNSPVRFTGQSHVFLVLFSALW